MEDFSIKEYSKEVSYRTIPAKDVDRSEDFKLIRDSLRNCKVNDSDVVLNYLVLVGPQNNVGCLPNEDELVKVNNPNWIGVKNFNFDNGHQILLERKTYSNFLDLCIELFEKNKITLYVTSGFRNFKLQDAVYEEIKAEYGEDYAKKHCAKKGESEHNTGIALDFGVDIPAKYRSSSFERGFVKVVNCALKPCRKVFKDLIKIDTRQNRYKIKAQDEVAKICENYGFIVRYPRGAEESTGYPYEPWHLRFVGSPENAKAINAWCTKEKEKDGKVHTFDDYYKYYAVISNGKFLTNDSEAWE